MPKKYNKTGRSKGDAKHVRLYEYMARTPAWRGLSGNAAKAWLEINLLYNGSNNGRIAVPTRLLGKRIGLSQRGATRAILELENAGFLRCTKAGDFGRKRIAAEYRLTHLRCDVTGEQASRDFKQTASANGNIVAFPGVAE